MTPEVLTVARVGVDLYQTLGAAALGCAVIAVDGLDELAAAYRKAREAARAQRRPAVVVVRTHPSSWTEAGAWWEVGIPDSSHRVDVAAARQRAAKEKTRQLRHIGRA